MAEYLRTCLTDAERKLLEARALLQCAEREGERLDMGVVAQRLADGPGEIDEALKTLDVAIRAYDQRLRNLLYRTSTKA